MKVSMKGSGGTSYHGHTVRTTKAQLVAAIGSPSWTSSEIEKSQNDWTCETTDGRVFTIYDWKIYRAYPDDMLIDWHIGAKDSYTAACGAEELEALIQKTH